MSADVTVHKILSGAPSVVSALGNRMYVDMLPESATVPAAVITLIDAIPIQGVWDQTGWWRSRVQVDVYGKTRGQTEVAAEAVQAALKRYRGTVGAVVVDDIQLDSARTDFSPDSEVRLFSMDFVTIYKE